MVVEAFVDLSLEATLNFLSLEAPDVSVIEVGSGGYAPHPHCDVEELLASEQARRDWLALLDRYDIGLDALNAWGNPVHPDADLARQHDQALRQAIRLATELGADRVVAMAGCPGGSATDHTPHFGAGGWLPYLEGVHERQWRRRRRADYWADLAEPLQSGRDPDLRSASNCIPARSSTMSRRSRTSPRSAPHFRRTSIRVISSGWAWTRDAVAEHICRPIGHIACEGHHVQRAEALALNGLLDHRWPSLPAAVPWNFATVGRGHDLAWWAVCCGRPRGIAGAETIAIEHEDPFVPPSPGSEGGGPHPLARPRPSAKTERRIMTRFAPP